MADEDQIGGRSGNNHAPHLVGGRPDDGSPEAGGESGQKTHEEADQDKARPAAGGVQAGAHSQVLARNPHVLHVPLDHPGRRRIGPEMVAAHDPSLVAALTHDRG